MKICLACGRTCATRYEWAHHGCEVPGVEREANRRARTDLPASQLQLSNIQAANFATNLTVPIGATGQFFTNLCGWGAVDAKVRGKTFRFVNTHLQAESPNPLANAVQLAQARELLTGPASTPLPATQRARKGSTRIPSVAAARGCSPTALIRRPAGVCASQRWQSTGTPSAA